jgi:hypothetical protein
LPATAARATSTAWRNGWVCAANDEHRQPLRQQGAGGQHAQRDALDRGCHRSEIGHANGGALVLDQGVCGQCSHAAQLQFAKLIQQLGENLYWLSTKAVRAAMRRWKLWRAAG